MATKKEIKEHLELALSEIGEIKPKYDRKLKDWGFSHPDYPVEYGGDSKEDVIENYPKYLEEFIKQRLNENLSPHVEKATRGRGGRRPGAGRPKGSKSATPSKQIRLPEDIAVWLKQPGVIQHLREMMQAYKQVRR